MWDEMLEHVMACLKEYNKDLYISMNDIEFILDSYFEYGEGICGRPQELSQDLKDEFYKFRIRCCNCGKEIILGQHFKEGDMINISGTKITCECGNEITIS